MEFLYISNVKIREKTLKMLAFRTEHGIIVTIIYTGEVKPSKRAGFLPGYMRKSDIPE